MNMETKRKVWNGIITMALSLFLLNVSCTTGEKGKVVLELKQGTLSLIPLERNAVRVQFAQPGGATPHAGTYLYGKLSRPGI